MRFKCPICDKRFEPYKDMRKDSTGKSYWCEECVNEFDAIDWEMVNEERHG